MNFENIRSYLPYGHKYTAKKTKGTWFVTATHGSLFFVGSGGSLLDAVLACSLKVSLGSI